MTEFAVIVVRPTAPAGSSMGMLLLLSAAEGALNALLCRLRKSLGCARKAHHGGLCSGEREAGCCHGSSIGTKCCLFSL